MFDHFPKHLDRTINFNSVNLKNTQIEPQNIFQRNKQCLESADKIKKKTILEEKKPTFRKDTVCKSPIKNKRNFGLCC